MWNKVDDKSKVLVERRKVAKTLLVINSLQVVRKYANAAPI